MGGKSSNVGTCSVRVERRKRIAIFKPGGREEEEEKNIFEAKNARVGKRATLISLVYGVAFCLINTPLVNHPCAGVLPILHSPSLSLCVCRHFILFFSSLFLPFAPLYFPDRPSFPSFTSLRDTFDRYLFASKSRVSDLKSGGGCVKKRRGTTFSTCRSLLLDSFLSLLAFSNISFFLYFLSSCAPFFSTFLLSLFFLSFSPQPSVRSPTNFVPLVGYSFQPEGRIAATGGFSSRHRVTLYPFRFIYIFPLRFSVRIARMNNKIMPTARRQLFGLDATLERIRSTPSFIPRIRAVIARLARDSKTNIPHDWNTMNYEGRSSWKHR